MTSKISTAKSVFAPTNTLYPNAVVFNLSRILSWHVPYFRLHIQKHISLVYLFPITGS